MGRTKGSKNKVKTMNNKDSGLGVSPKLTDRVIENVSKAKVDPLPGEVQGASVQLPEVTQSTKAYIFDNYQKKSLEELAKDTGLNEAQIEKLLTSSEMDTRPVVESVGESSPANLR